MKIYILKGEWGEYDDHTEWTVAVYLDKELAEEHQKWCRKHADDSVRPRPQNPYDDECFCSGYRDTEYRVYEMDVSEAVPSADPVT